MKFFTAFSLGLLSLNAMALPILTESVDGSGSIATIYPDHENPNKVYFMPNRGSLQKNGSGIPEFGLTYWGLKTPETAGGYLAAILNLSTGAELQTAINSQLAKGKQVAVLPVQKSYIDFATNDEKPTMDVMFESLDLPDFSGRAEDSFGFQATLTPVGARALPALLKSGGAGAVMSYCYQVTGLSPVFNAKITLNYYKVYEHFLAQAKVGRWFWKAKIRTEIEKLLENKTIQIEINGGDAKKADYVMALMDRMVEKFFEPQLQNRRNSAGGRIGISYTKIVEDRKQTFQLTQRELITRDYCIGMSLNDLKKYPELIVNADNAEL